MTVGDDNMWVNVGRSSFTCRRAASRRCCAARRRRGARSRRAGEAAAERAPRSSPRRASRFAEKSEHIEATCPWGNDIRALRAADRFGEHEARHAVRRVDGAAAAPRPASRASTSRDSACKREGRGAAPRIVPVGAQPEADLPRDRRAPPAPTTGTTSRSTSRISPGRTSSSLKRGLITEESNQYQYRFQDIVDPENGTLLFELEHEVRSLHAPAVRPPVREPQPGAEQRTYVRGLDAFVADK